MVSHPIHLKRVSYRGRDATKRSKVASENAMIGEIERKINEHLLQQSSPIQVYTWGSLAMRIGVSCDALEKYGPWIDGGSNGFTAVRHDLTYEQAMKLQGLS